MNSWHSYPSIFNLGHRAVADLLTVPVNVEEKIDGSQFSFGVFSHCTTCGAEMGKLSCECFIKDPNATVEYGPKIRSKGAQMLIDAPEKMFTRAAETVRELTSLLRPGWTYRAEYLAKPKHNALVYDRVPEKHLIIFDINDGEESYLSYEAKVLEAARIGLEVVPRIYSGRVSGLEMFREFLAQDSILGGQKVEGVVVKPAAYNLYALDKKVLMGKFVSEAFKEIHSAEWKKENPSGSDILATIGDSLRTPARWQKAVQHLREAGQLEDSPRDIGALMREVPADIEKECRDEIIEALMKWAWPHIRRISTRGLPEWYKEELLKKQFE